MNDEIPEEIAADLPPPRSDEPTSLRQDIIDELADHLTCSVQREQFREGAAGHSESQLWQRVLQRFGSPGDVARRLWFDWMWEKIVMQRVTLFLMIAMVACTIAMFVTMNQSLQASRESQTMLMKEILAIKESKPTAAAPSQPAEWNNLKIKVVYDDENKTPVEGAEVTITGRTDKTRTIPNVYQLTDSKGEIDCGMVLYGAYAVNLTLAKDAMSLHTADRIAIVRPGQDELFEIVLPQELTREVDFHLDLSEAIKDIKDTDFEESRIWCLNTQLTANHVYAGESKSGDSLTLVAVPQKKRDHMEGIFITTRGAVESSALERVDRFERFEGLLDAKDERIHRFSDDRRLIPEGAQLKDSVPLGYGVYPNMPGNNVLYLEMKLKDGRRILTKVPDLFVSGFFTPIGSYSNPLLTNEFEALRKKCMNTIDMKFYSNPSSGKKKGTAGFFPGQALSNEYHFSVSPLLDGGSEETIDVQILPSQQSLEVLNSLSTIPENLVLVSVKLSTLDKFADWQAQKFDLFLTDTTNKDESAITQDAQIFAVLPWIERVSPSGIIREKFCLIGIPEQEFTTALQSLLKGLGEDDQQRQSLLLTAKPSQLAEPKPDAPKDSKESADNDN